MCPWGLVSCKKKKKKKAIYKWRAGNYSITYSAEKQDMELHLKLKIL